MLELAAWIERLRALKVDETTTHFPARTQMYRVSAPTALDFDDSTVRVQATGQEVYLFGNFPNQLSILFWSDPDLSPNFARDQTIATQLGAILTLATNRKIRVASSEITTGMDGSDMTTFLPSSMDDRELIGPLPQGTGMEFERVLRQVAGLPAEHLAAVGSAIELHYAASQLFDTDVDTAHTLAVAGIETLSGHFEIQEAQWAEFDDAARFDDVFARLALDPSATKQLQDAILKGKQLKLRQRFATYVCTRLPPSFWDSTIVGFVPELEVTAGTGATFKGLVESEVTPIANVVPRDLNVLRRRLLATYDSRSRYVHAGARAHDVIGAMNALNGRSVPEKTPIVFAGVRRILQALIHVELEAHSLDHPLPDVRLLHGGSSPGAGLP